MIEYLERLREQFIDGSGWDKMGRNRPTNDWADKQINAMSLVELLQQIDWIRQDESES